MPAADLPPPDDPRAEALLYLRWIRHAGGRNFWRDPAPSPGAKAEKSAPLAEPPLPRDREDLASIAAAVKACRRCPLAETRTQAVPGEGSATPRLVVVGEAPGAEEDATGRPFVGKAGQLLTRMLAAIGLSREEVFIGNTLKCRPPDNRPPEPHETAACRPFLLQQLRLLDPPLILTLGNHATKALLETDQGITTLRGKFQRSPQGWRVMPTFHPSYLLRYPPAKKDAWEDLQRVARELGLALPKPSGE